VYLATFRVHIAGIIYFRPLGYQPTFMMRTLTVMISYFSNLGIPRSGEVLRATALATYADVPF
jgi:hypothetical protein